MVETAKFQERLSDATTSLSQELKEVLKPWISSNILLKYQDNLLRDVLRPACKLQSLMACSQSEYFWELPKIQRGKRPDSAIAHMWTFKNIEFWRPTTYEDIDSVFNCLFPALFRRRVDGGGNQLVAKPIVLAYKKKTSQG